MGVYNIAKESRTGRHTHSANWGLPEGALPGPRVSAESTATSPLASSSRKHPLL